MHCAAFTAVDLAEDEAERCDLINCVGTEAVALACAEIDCKLLFISTDYVFSGEGERPWEPDDPPKPLNMYGLSKWRGEEAVRAHVERHFIVRISWLFGLNGQNFVKTMLRLGKEREQIRVVNDQVGSPTYTKDLSVLLADMIVTEQYGTYHATNEGTCSWYEFACAIAGYAGHINCDIQPCNSDEFPSKVHRPAYSVLDKTRIKRELGITIPHWRDALKKCLEELLQ